MLLRDVAEVQEGLENKRVGGWFRGEPAVILDMQRQPGANIIQTVDRFWPSCRGCSAPCRAASS